jgi:hypothetical protein
MMNINLDMMNHLKEIPRRTELEHIKKFWQIYLPFEINFLSKTWRDKKKSNNTLARMSKSNLSKVFKCCFVKPKNKIKLR